MDGWVRDDRPLIRTRENLMKRIAHVLRLQLSYLSKDQALAVADTVLSTLKAARLSAAQMMPAARGVMETAVLVLSPPYLTRHPRQCNGAPCRAFGCPQAGRTLGSASPPGLYDFPSSADLHFKRIG